MVGFSALVGRVVAVAPSPVGLLVRALDVVPSASAGAAPVEVVLPAVHEAVRVLGGRFAAVLAEENPTKCQFISQISFEHLYVQTHMYRPMCVLYMFIHQVQCVASMCTSKTRSSTQADRHRQISYMYTDRTHSYRLLVLVQLPYRNDTCVSATMM